MKLLYTFVCIVLASLFSDRCLAVQAEEQLAAAIGQSIGDLQMSVSTLNRGVVQQGEVLTFDFPYKVEGTGPVRILGIHQDCGCLMTELRAGMVLESGSTGVLRVQANTAHFFGPFDKKITILTNESDKISYTLRVLARIERSVSWSPALVELDFHQNQVNFSKVTIKPLSKQRIHIEKLRYNEDNLEVVALEKDHSWELQVRWKGEKPNKPWAENIEVTTDGIVRSFRIPVVERVPQQQAKLP